MPSKGGCLRFNALAAVRARAAHAGPLTVSCGNKTACEWRCTASAAVAHTACVRMRSEPWADEWETKIKPHGGKKKQQPAGPAHLVQERLVALPLLTGRVHQNDLECQAIEGPQLAFATGDDGRCPGRVVHQRQLTKGIPLPVCDHLSTTQDRTREAERQHGMTASTGTQSIHRHSTHVHAANSGWGASVHR
jgi:hypothetical protein